MDLLRKWSARPIEDWKEPVRSRMGLPNINRETARVVTRLSPSEDGSVTHTVYHGYIPLDF